MTDRWRIAANLATLANALLGLGAILYVLAGNKVWAMLLVASAIGFDGLDGLFSRRSPSPSSPFGRVADSVADGLTFGLAPAFLIAVHTSDIALWSPWETAMLAAAAGYVAAAVGRLVYFTVRGYQRPYFLGAPTPQAALALIVALLFHDSPAFQTVQPLAIVVAVAVLGALMVVPIPFPKIRREAPLRLPMAATGVAAVVALLPLQFHPAVASALYSVSYAAALFLLVGVASYFLVGPFTVDRHPPDVAGT